MGLVQKAGVLFLLCVIAVLSLHELSHSDRYGHLVRFGLHADLVVSKEDGGLEGITKSYEARLTNYGLFPAKITACEFTFNAARGTKVAYVVEQWDRRQNKWKTLSLGNLRFASRIPWEFRRRICTRLFYGLDRVSGRAKKPLQREIVSKLGIMHGSQSSLERKGIGEMLFRLPRFALTNTQRTLLFGMCTINDETGK